MFIQIFVQTKTELRVYKEFFFSLWSHTLSKHGDMIDDQDHLVHEKDFYKI